MYITVAMSVTAISRPSTAELAALEAIERRVLWLATRIVDYANRERPNVDSLKVGGHQASSASLVTLMTAVDFSTGSVGLGSVAPLFGALADRYAGTHGLGRTGGRFISLLGDAELDEGS